MFIPHTLSSLRQEVLSLLVSYLQTQGDHRHDLQNGSEVAHHRQVHLRLSEQRLLDLAKARSFAALLENISTVSWVWRRSVMVRRLPPQLLSRYLYPQLSTYSDSNTLHIPRLNLSMRSLLAV